MKAYKDIADSIMSSYNKKIHSFFEILRGSELTYREKLTVLLESGFINGIGSDIHDCPPSFEDKVKDYASDYGRGVYYFSDRILDEILSENDSTYSEEECKELFDWFIENELIGCEIDW